MHRAILIAIEDEIEASAIHTSEEGGFGAMNDAAPEEAATSAEAPVAAGGTLADMERQMILNTLDQCLGNRTQASRILGISIRTLRNKLKQYEDEGHL